MELFAANLKKRAQELGISNAEVARRAGLSERRYGNYVSGRREPDLATLTKIASVLATTPTDLLTATADDSSYTSPKKLRAFAALNAIEGPELDIIVVMLEAVAARVNRP